MAFSHSDAGIKTFIAGGGDFHDPLNWSPPGVPTSADRVVIPSGGTCYIQQDTMIDTVEIEAGATLLLDPLVTNITLTLLNSTNNTGGFPDNSLIDGTLECASGGFGTLFSHLYFDSTHTLTGEGVVRLTGGDIIINDARTLTNELAVPGKGVRGGYTVRALGSAEVKRTGSATVALRPRMEMSCSRAMSI
jgi:hypothetical protein